MQGDVPGIQRRIDSEEIPVLGSDPWISLRQRVAVTRPDLLEEMVRAAAGAQSAV